MTTPLFTEHARYTAEAFQLEDRVQGALAPIFDEFVARGYSPRDIGHIALLAVMELELMRMLGYAAQEESPNRAADRLMQTDAGRRVLRACLRQLGLGLDPDVVAQRG